MTDNITTDKDRGQLSQPVEPLESGGSALPAAAGAWPIRRRA